MDASSQSRVPRKAFQIRALSTASLPTRIASLEPNSPRDHGVATHKFPVDL